MRPDVQPFGGGRDASGVTGACSPLTRTALRELVEFRPGWFVAIVGAAAPEMVAAASRAIGTSGCLMLVSGCEAGDRLVEPVGNVEMVRGSPLDIQLSSFTADLVISCCTIHREGDVAKAYEEVHRILRIGGRFVISDLVSARTASSVEFPSPPSCADCGSRVLTEAEYLRAASSAGFQRLEILQRTAPYDLAGLRVSSIVLTGLRSSVADRS